MGQKWVQTQQDLKLFFAENNRDTEDGGGLRTGKALTGKDNELFPPWVTSPTLWAI